MDAIRKKMQSLKAETNSYEATAKRHEEQAAEMNASSDKNDALIRDLNKKIGNIEANLEDCLEKFNKTVAALEEKEKELTSLEDDVGSVSRRLVLLEIESKDADTRMGETVKNLAFTSKEADTILKKVRYFESKNMNNEMTIEDQEKDLREANTIVADSEKKLDEISRRYGVVESELKRAMERAELAESELVRVETELRNIGENMKLLEVSEEKALAREEKFKQQIKAVMHRLKEADKRAEYGEMNITKLNIRIDDIEDEIVREKLKIKKVSDELGDTFDEMLSKYWFPLPISPLWVNPPQTKTYIMPITDQSGEWFHMRNSIIGPCIMNKWKVREREKSYLYFMGTTFASYNLSYSTPLKHSVCN